MEAVLGLLLLLGASHGVETFCDGRQDGAQCYGALGGGVDVQLMDSTSEIFRYQWKKGSTSILHGRKNRIVSNLIESRSSFTPSNGTFRINDLSRNDSGEYTLEIYDDSGTNPVKRTLQLTIQAPVSSVQLVSECLSQGEKRVSCSSEGGDSPQYSWTLGGNTLTDTQLLSGSKESQNITLKVEVSGRLVCSVRNNISSKSKEEEISTCGFEFFDCELLNGTHIKQWLIPTNETQCIKPTTIPTEEVQSYLLIMAGVLSALVILLVVGLAIVWAGKKKRNKPKEGEEDDQDLTYADVRIMQQQGRQAQPRAEMEVEYGQVKFSERPPRAVEPAGDECVYAKVRKGR